MAVLRWFFFLFALANLVFFAWAQGYLGGAGEGREPARLADQLQPDKLRVVGSDPAPATPPAPACKLVTGLSLADAQGLGTAVAEKADGLAATVTPVVEPARHWVHIPALATKAAADKKAAEIRALGVTDFHLLQEEGTDHFAISLGLFGTEAAASEFLAGLNKKGIKSARAELREKAPETARVEIAGPAALLAKRLPDLVAGLPTAAVSDCK